MSGRHHRLPAGVPFADALAAGLLARTEGDPLALASFTILLPTRRATRTLRDAFLRQSEGRPILLPRLLPLGDLDAEELTLTTGANIPPAISPRRRQLLLAQLIAKYRPDWPTAEHLALARSLAQLIDDITTEQVDLTKLDDLAGDLASHWQVTLNFLKPVLTLWPGILEAEGVIDGAERRNRLLAAQVEAWQKNPPQTPVIAAGSTGAIPAMREVLREVLRLPQGEIVLPGLPAFEESAEWWDKLDEPHPLYELKQLLDALSINPAEITLWPCEDVAHPRRHLLHQALLPAAATEGWANLPSFNAATLTRIDCDNEQEEASAVALKLREVLETPGRTATLVTPDRNLGRRVIEQLKRWNVVLDDSAGLPLAKTPPAMLLRLLLAYVVAPGNVNLLSLAKHPLFAGGLAPSECRNRVREIEREALRGPRRTPGLAALLSRNPPQAEWLRTLLTILTPLQELVACKLIDLRQLVVELVTAAEHLASTDTTPGPERLWRGQEGEVLAAWVAELLEAARDFPPLKPDDLEGLLLTLLSDGVVRPRYGEHPRLKLLGPLEARLGQADVTILSGLNEGIWPAPPAPDPWLSRPMRRDFGLKSPEARLGQEAHDFYCLTAAPEVMLTRAAKQGGTPTVPSRWLRRLDTVLKATNTTAPYTKGQEWLALTRQLDRADTPMPIQPPSPRPPLEARPNRLSVTQVETLRRDPYAIYAKKILDLVKLDDIEPQPGGAERGNFIHAVLQKFMLRYPHYLPASAREELLDLGRKELVLQGLEQEAPWWWPRFVRAADWFIATEAASRKAGHVPLAHEEYGEMLLPGGFTLHAKADRIDRVEGGLAIIDYKTGGIPSKTEQERGFSVQLPLEAAIARAGGFKKVPPAAVKQLAFWHITGKEEAGNVVEFRKGADPTQLANEALDGLTRLLDRFRDEEMSYLAQPHGDMKPRYSDYLHLARVKEWGSQDEEEDAS